jgi:hypothetical protein
MRKRKSLVFTTIIGMAAALTSLASSGSALAEVSHQERPSGSSFTSGEAATENKRLSAPAVEFSAAGEPGPYRVQNRATGRCLDSNPDGGPHYGPCNVSDRGQQWIIWNGGWVKNIATGKCLVQYDNLRVDTETCRNVTWQYWRNWTPEWFQNVYFGVELGCLVDVMNGIPADVGPCYHDNASYWYVTMW